MTTPLTEPVYPVGNRHLSMQDLLNYFVASEHLLRGMSRYSDLHLKVGEPVCFRYDGDLKPLPEGASLTQEMVEKMIFPLLREKQVSRLQADPPGDVDASWEWLEKRVSFRLNVFTDRDGLAAVLRVLPTQVPDVQQIGFPVDKVWQDICKMEQGLVLLTGNTGSGKSTTIAAMVNYVNQTRPVRIITLEDPIEFLFKSKRALFSQRELGRNIPTFSDGLRSALREDPDVIYVGEMRDRETVALALTAAETGHLVFSTLHTRDTRGAITRIIDMFPAERTKEVAVQLSMGLAYVICQKLVSRADGGRCVAMEVLKNTTSIANLIRTGGIHQIASQLETSMKDGMNTLEFHLRLMVQAGKITAEEALRSANDPAALKSLIG